jgi:cell division septal protein FtsQ
VALVRRNGGFYLLDGAGDLRGPIVPEAQPDLPILSGDCIADADAPTLVRDATVLVRAEARLNHLVSEMKTASDDTATLFLDHPQAAIVIDLNRDAASIQRGVRILQMWRGHERMIAAIDLTSPDEAVVRLRQGVQDQAGTAAGGLAEVAFAPATGNGASHHPARHSH